MHLPPRLHWFPLPVWGQRMWFPALSQWRHLSRCSWFLPVFLPQRVFRQSLSGTPTRWHVMYLYLFRCLNVAVFKICLYDRLQSNGADAHLLAKMEDAVDKKMLPLCVSVLMAGLDATATSVGSPVKRLLDKEVCLSWHFEILTLCQQWSIIFSQSVLIRHPDRWTVPPRRSLRQHWEHPLL